MSEEKIDTKSKIIAAAMEMIGKEGNLNATIRDISKRADVNLASINYHFQSKNNLLQEVELHFVEETKKMYDVLFDYSKDPRHRIVRWALQMMKHLIDFPGIFFILAMRLFKGRWSQEGVVELLNRSEVNLRSIVREVTGIEDEQLIAVKVMQLMSGVINPVILYHGAGKSFRVDIRDEDERTKYIEHLVESVIR